MRCVDKSHMQTKEVSGEREGELLGSLVRQMTDIKENTETHLAIRHSSMPMYSLRVHHLLCGIGVYVFSSRLTNIN